MVRLAKDFFSGDRGRLFVEIVAIESNDYNGVVYDFEVEKYHNYLVTYI